ncbi:MAG TPA: hypothetical protein VMZ29_16260 [Candidatus Bathyarchaeia archaeon]|nr:hypothetical protein [Candidatus Bathyarchaeia archaeon]
MKTLDVLTKKWVEVNQLETVDFTINEWKKKGSNLTIEQLQNWFQRLNLDFPPICVQTFTEDGMVGWLLLVYHSDIEAEINPWLLNGHPICKQDYNNGDEISRLLI